VVWLLPGGRASRYQIDRLKCDGWHDHQFWLKTGRLEKTGPQCNPLHFNLNRSIW
jgi:hypothetical protein